MNRKHLVTLVALCFAAPAVAEMDFAKIDVDGDGFISADESAAIPQLADVLADVDQDADGKLDAEEFAKAMEIIEPADKGG